MKKIPIQSLMILSLAVAAVVPSRASTITIDFNNNGLFAAFPGQADVAVFATLTNTDPVNTVFLNGDNLNVPGAASVTDEFFTNAPLSLNPGETTASVELFRFQVASNASAGSLAGSYQLLGGVGTAAQFNFDVVGSQIFTVAVRNTPEPSSDLLLGSALIGLSFYGRRRFTRSKT